MNIELPARKRKIDDIAAEADHLPEATLDAIQTCPFAKKEKRALRVTPRLLVFQTVPLGTAPPPLDVTIANDGDAPFDVTSVIADGSHGSFTIVRGPASTTIAARGDQTLTISAAAPGTVAPPKGALEVTTSNAGTATVELEASAYALTSVVANTTTISPGVDDADIHYVVNDPNRAVGQATITIHEIDHRTNAIGKVIGTMPGQPYEHGPQKLAWRGEVDDTGYRVRDDVRPFITKRNAPYRVKVTIARGDGSGALEGTCDVGVKNTGELTIQISRPDGAALVVRAAVNVTAVASRTMTSHTTVTKAGGPPTCDELVIKGLAPGDYDVQIMGTLASPAAGLTAYLNAQGGGGGWRIAPSQTGIVRAAVKIGERANASFQVTRYAHLQFIGFHATPTGTNRNLASPLQATYKGEADDRHDMIARCQIMKAAMAAAEADHTKSPVDDTILKVFMAPEFYFRGQGGGYLIEIVEEILPKLLEEASLPKYADWIFVYGTAIGYHKHGDGTPERYVLAVSQDLGGNPQTVRVTAGLGGAASTVNVCEHIPPNRPAPVQWQLDQGGAIAAVQTATRINPTEFDLLLTAGATINVGAVELVEPLATEIFNVALVQRGGPTPGEPRDLLVYKDYVSSIDFLGKHHPDVLKDFYVAHASHLADIHGTGERYIMPTEGSVDPFGTRPNPAAAGGTSEQNRTALGGGSLFSMAGVNFGIEVCLDHLSERLNTYGANATPGDSMPQIHLIPSWGMTIDGGPIYAVPNGLVFNVDGRPTAPQAGTFTGFRCPDAPHNGAVVNAPRPPACLRDHARCDWHYHTQAAGGACVRCSTATIAGPGFPCTTVGHWMLATPCTCGLDLSAKKIVECPAHGSLGIGGCSTVGCTAPQVDLYGCGITGHYQAAPSACKGNVGLCGSATTLLYYCNAAAHLVGVNPCPGCGAPTAALMTNMCNRHTHTEHVAPGSNCTFCGNVLVADPRPLAQDWTPITAVGPAALVPDPGGPCAVNDQSTITRTVVTDTVSGLVTSDTTVVHPANRAPLEVPQVAPNNDTGALSNPRTRTWLTPPLTLTCVHSSVTLVTGTTTTVTTTITTSRTGNVQAAWANLFAQQGALYIYPAQALQQAATV